jgi:Zn-dependent protease with chaperone function
VTSANGESLTPPTRIADTNVSSRLGNMPRILRFNNGGVFETADNNAVDAALKPHKSAWFGVPHRLESGLKYALLGVVLAVAVVFGFLRYGIPAIAEYAAYAMPAKVARAVGQGTLETLDKQVFQPSQIPAEKQTRLRQKFHAFIDQIDGIPVEVQFRRGGGIGANALALPSGVIIFTDELVGLTDDDNDLVAIYAHEAGHVAQRHAMRQVLQAAAFTITLALITGDVSASSELVVIAPTLLLTSSYSRHFEREADRFALDEMNERHIPPQHFITMLNKLEAWHRKRQPDRDKDSDKWLDYLASHPPTEERKAMFRGS